MPSNDVAWDVLAQVGAAIRKGGAQSPLPGLDPKHLYMAGYSQSGVDTAGFAIGLAKHYGTPAGKPMFDGYFPAAQAASATPLKAGTSVLPKFEYPVWPAVGVPVVNLEDQSGVMGFTAELPADAQATLGQKDYTNVSSASMRRADSDKKGDQYRLYEVAGMPHAPGGGGCEGPPSTFPVTAVTRGTFALLNRWVETGQKPPRAPRVEDGRDRQELQGRGRPERQRPRRRPVAVPRRRARPLRRAGARPDHLRARGPRGAARRAALAKAYPSVDAYMKKFTKGLDAMIKAGYIIPPDRAQLIADQKEKATQVLGRSRRRAVPLTGHPVGVIYGAHVIVFSSDPDADRAFLADVLGFEHVDAGGGWLVFGLPPAEVAVHPAEASAAELYLMCDDLTAELQRLDARGVRCSAVEEARWGSVTKIALPGGGEVGLYQPKHPAMVEPR